MNIKYYIGKYKNPDTEEVSDTFEIEEPFKALSMVCLIFNNIDDLDLYIKWLQEDIICANIPDYSLENGIEWQPLLMGSKKSKIASWKDGKLIPGVEFETKNLLDLCYAWRDFLLKRQV